MDYSSRLDSQPWQKEPELPPLPPPKADVIFDRVSGKFQARVKYMGLTVYYGGFDTYDDAEAFWRKKMAEIGGAKTN